MNGEGDTCNWTDATRPRVLILDDVPVEVEGLIGDLQNDPVRYLTTHVATTEEFYRFLDSNFVQLLLIDVSLSPGGDSRGLAVAADCCAKYPEAKRMCISRQAIVKIRADQIIDAMNPRPELDGRRHFDAFGEKSHPATILDLIRLCRARTVCGDETRVVLDEQLATEVESGLTMLVDKDEVVPEPKRQFMEVIKQMARRPAMPPVKTILLRRIGKGRSRTVVAEMTLHFERDPRPLRLIVKVGRHDLISQELQRYATYVPQFLSHAQYPFLESTGTARTLAGLSYGFLGKLDDGGLPPTLRDLILSDLHPVDQCTRAIARVFDRLIAIEGASRPRRPRALVEEYSERFHALRDPEALTTIFDGATTRLSALGLCELSKSGKSISLRRRTNKKLDTIAVSLAGPLAYERYNEAIVHGDLHLDNIVFSSDTLDDSFYFIDFAHTGPHHVFLDHVVMELGCRLQLSNALLTEFRDRDKELYEVLLSFETALEERAFSPSAEPGISNTTVMRLWQLIATIRGEAARRWPKEPPYQYLAAVGLVHTAALRLPLPEPFKATFRVWASLVAAINLSAFERVRTAKNDISLWHYRQEKPGDEQALAVARSFWPIFERALMHKTIEYEKRGEHANQLLDRIDAAAKDLATQIENFKQQLPQASSLMESLVNKLSEKHHAKIVGRLGLPFLMIQLERAIQLPPRAAEIAGRIRAILGIQ